MCTIYVFTSIYESGENVSKIFYLNGNRLTLESIERHFSDKSRIGFSKSSWEKVAESNTFFDSILNKQLKCYGLNTGFGDLIDFEIDREEQINLQKRLALSHAVGAGNELNENICRMILLLRLNYLAKGTSSVKRETIERILFFYNNGIYPLVFEKGSLGASGDLAPLSHVAAFFIGEGWGYQNGIKKSSAELHRKYNLDTLKYDRKEALSLINGTSALTAIGLKSISNLKCYSELAVILMMYLAIDAKVSLDFINEKAFEKKPHQGSVKIVRYIKQLIANLRYTSQASILQSPYSFRCMPMILGPLIESLERAQNTLEIESNSASDNPLYLGEGELYHGGHFHGHPVSISLDQLRIAAVNLSGVIDRQLEFVMDRKRNYSRIPFMTNFANQGYCGLEGAQYLVTSLHIENKRIASPINFLTLPTNAGNQDYVSLGMQSALATLELSDNIRLILGVLILAVIQQNSLVLNNTRSPNITTSIVEILKKSFGEEYLDDVLLSERIIENSSDSKLRNLLLSLRAEHKINLFGK